MKQESYLAFDVNSAEGFGSCSFEVPLGFAHHKVENRVTLFKEPLGLVVDKKLIRVAVGIKPKFLGDEPKPYI